MYVRKTELIMVIIATLYLITKNIDNIFKVIAVMFIITLNKKAIDCHLQNFNLDNKYPIKI